MVSSSTMTVHPDIDEAFALRGWYDAVGVEKSFQSHSAFTSSGPQGGFNRAEARDLKSLKDSQVGMSDKVESFSTRATIMHIKPETISYPACPTQGCNKKVVQNNDSWRCEKCDRSFQSPEHRCARFLIRSPEAKITPLGILYPWLWLTGLVKLGFKALTMPV